MSRQHRAESLTPGSVVVGLKASLLVGGVLLLATCLPQEPTITVDFSLQDTLVRVPVSGALVPGVGVNVDGEPLADAPYRLESLNPAAFSVDETGHGVLGVKRDTGSVRVVFLSGASGGAAPDTTFRVQVVAAAVEVTAPLDTLEELGDSTGFTATAYDADSAEIEDVTFRWSSSDTIVATVDASTGWVKAIDEGEATISAEVDGTADSATIAVIQVVTDVQVSPGADTVWAVTWTASFDAAAYRDGRGNLPNAKFSWRSSDTGVAVVDADGVATARGEGVASIIASAGEAADTAQLRVDQIARYVFVRPRDPTVAVNDSVRLTASAQDSASQDIPNPGFAWGSADPAVATVNGGLVTTVGTGTVTIAATADGATGSATVTALVPDRLAVGSGDITFEKWWDTVVLDATVRDADNTVIDSVTRTWSSSDEQVATVDASGVVTAVGNGVATISVSITGGLSDSAVVTVQQDAVDTVQVQIRSGAPSVGASVGDLPADLFEAIPMDAGGNPVTAGIRWTSLNPQIAEIDPWTGEVTAKGCGQVTIKAESGGSVAYGLLTVQNPTLPRVESWREYDLPSGVNAMWGTSSTDVFAAAGGHRFYHFDGSEWTEQPNGPNANLSHLWGTSANDLWAASGQDLWHYDGDGWAIHMTFSGVTLTSVWGTSPADLWLGAIVGESDPFVYHVQDQNWDAQPLPVSLAPNASLAGVGAWGFSATDVWASQPFNSVISHWDGGKWNGFPQSVGGQLVWGAVPGDLWISRQVLTGNLNYTSMVVNHVTGSTPPWPAETVYQIPAGGCADLASFGGAAAKDVYFVVARDYCNQTDVVSRWNGIEPVETYDLGSQAAGSVWTAPDNCSVWILADDKILRGTRQ